MKELNTLKALNRLNRKSDKTKRYGPIRRGEIKVLRLAPEGGEKRGNKTVEEPPVSNKFDPIRD